MYIMTADLASGLIEIEIAGVLSPDDVAGFGRELEAQARTIALRGKRHTLLVDYTRAQIQPQAVVTAFQDLSKGIGSPARRCALFTDGVLARLQAKRIVTSRATMAAFEDRASALAWLMEKDAPRAAAPMTQADAR